jgi:hypothetical protein
MRKPLIVRPGLPIAVVLSLLVGCGDDAAGVTDASTGVMTSVGPSPGTTTQPSTGEVPTTTDPDTIGSATGTGGTTTTGVVEPTTGGTTVVTSLDTTNSTSTVGESTAGESTIGESTIGESTAGESTAGESSTGGVCPDGTIVCDGDTKQVCDGMGGFKDVEACTGICIPGQGCTVCVPNEATCEGDVAHVCNDEGSGTVDVVCDGVQGVTCEADLGCTGACAPATLGLSYIGCDYYPTVTANVVGNNFHFAVAVANTTGQPANVRIDQGNNVVLNDMVAPNGVSVINLPWVASLKADRRTRPRSRPSAARTACAPTSRSPSTSTTRSSTRSGRTTTRSPTTPRCCCRSTRGPGTTSSRPATSGCGAARSTTLASTP